MVLKNWEPGGSLDTTVAMAGGVSAFIAATAVSRKLAKDLPGSPFLSQILVGGSLSLATFLFAKHVFGGDSEIPASLFTGTSSAYLSRYTEAMYD